MRNRFTILFLLLSTLAFAQVDTEFWFAIPYLTNQHDESSKSGQGRLYFTAFQDTAHITVTQPAITNPQDGYYVAPKTIIVPPDSSVYVFVGGTGGLNRVANSGNSYCGVHIESDVNITSYFAQTNNNSEIYTLKGRNALGTDFLVPFQRKHGNAHGGVSSVEIIATEANTTVTVTMPGMFGTTQTITLTRVGETYTIPEPNGSTNLGGMVITSDKPIAVNTTDDSVQAGGQDLMGEQLVPRGLAGADYIAVKHNTTSDEILYLYSFPGQPVNYQVNGAPQQYLAAGSYATIPLTSDVTYISGDTTFVCFQMTGDGGELGGTVLPRLECTGSREVALHRQFSNQRVVLMVNSANTNTFRVNGQPAMFTFTDIPGTDWSYALVTSGLFNNRGVARIVNDSAVFHCAVLDYGGGTCSYGYFSAYGQVAMHPVSDKEVYLAGETMDIRLPDAVLFQSIHWILPDGTVIESDSLHMPATEGGYYRVTAVSREGCILDIDTAEVLVHVVRPTRRDSTVCRSDLFPQDTYVLYDSLHVGTNLWRDTAMQEAPAALTAREQLAVHQGSTYRFEVNVKSIGTGAMTCNLYVGDQQVYTQSNIRATTATKPVACSWVAPFSGQTEVRAELSSASSSARVQIVQPLFAPMMTVQDTLYLHPEDCTPPCPEPTTYSMTVENYCDTLLPYPWRPENEDTTFMVPRGGNFYYRIYLITNGTDSCLLREHILHLHTVHCEPDPEPRPCPELQRDTTWVLAYCDTLPAYQWHGLSLTESGFYSDTVLTQIPYDDGYCDSLIYVLSLEVIPCEPDPEPRPCPELQRDTTWVLAYCDTLPAYQWHGLSLTESGFYSDTVLTMIAYDEGYCDSLIYVLSLEVIPCEPDPEPEPDPECLEVIAQRWDDVLFVLNTDYNGGYEFVRFSWLRNGELTGDTLSYFYQPDKLREEDTYEVLLVTADGQQYRACPYRPVLPENDAAPAARKVLHQGRIIILRDDQYYNLLGLPGSNH